nr:OmpA family protein [Nannocystis sp. SCPEA4]
MATTLSCRYAPSRVETPSPVSKQIAREQATSESSGEAVAVAVVDPAPAASREPQPGPVDGGCISPVELQEAAWDLANVRFRARSTEQLAANGEALLDRAARALRGYPDVAVTLRMRCDERSAPMNPDVCELKRGHHLREALIRRAVEPDRVHVLGAGDGRAIAGQGDRAGRAVNEITEVSLDPHVFDGSPPTCVTPLALQQLQWQLRLLRFASDTTLAGHPDGALDRAARVLSEHADVAVELRVYCDRSTASSERVAVARRRGEHVRELLVRRGIAAERIHVAAGGDGKPVVASGTAEARAVNERIEAVLVGLP